MGLHPHGIAPTFLKLDAWSPGVGFVSTKENKLDKERKIVSFMHTKRLNTFKKISFDLLLLKKNAKKYLLFYFNDQRYSKVQFCLLTYFSSL